MTNHMETKKYLSKYCPPNIPTTTPKLISFQKNEHKEAANKYNELLNDPKVYSLYMDLVEDEWIIDYEVYTDAWLKKYGTRR